MSIAKKLFIIILSLQLTLMSFAQATPTCTSPEIQNGESFTRLCKNVDDIICKNIPDKIRRSCDEREQTIIHSGMTSNEVYNMAVGCFKIASTSFVEFFTKFIPDLMKAIWNLTKGAYENASQALGFFSTLKGHYESARSLTADVIEAYNKDPGQFFADLWFKITEAVGPLVANYDCMNPQAKVEKICGIVAEWVIPPAMLAKVIVNGVKAAKELYILKMISKLGEVNGTRAIAAFENAPKVTLKQYHALFNQFKEKGYTLEDFREMFLIGVLSKIKPEELKSLSTAEGRKQYFDLLGKESKNSTVVISPIDAYKEKYGKELKLGSKANAKFIAQVEADIIKKEANVIYFDVENSVQKKLNDEIFKEKTAVDALNNSFFIKFNKNLRKYPELMKRLKGEYKDYKSYRIRLELKPGDDPEKYQRMLSDLYLKTNQEFSLDPLLRDIGHELPPRTDNLSTPSTWFLAGTGENALEANMAARAGRKSIAQGENNPLLNTFKQHAHSLLQEIDSIEQTRKALSANPLLLEKRILETASNGNVIPSKSMIGILRKIKPAEFQTEEEFLAIVISKSEEIFGLKLDQQTAKSLASYFQQVDSLSPPLFSTERVAINLKEAKKGIVSVDFAGIGVDNIYEQMKGLSEIAKTALSENKLHESFAKMQRGINEVTKLMEESKSFFTNAVADIEKSDKKTPQFSGDDGIFMPGNRLWNENDKAKLVSTLSTSPDPSKYRVTFVSSTYLEGKTIPVAERSKRIIRAETLEKEIRAKIIGSNKITEEQAKKFITAIDYSPAQKGGIFHLIIGGKNFSAEEKNLIEEALRESINGAGEIAGKITYITQ